MLYALKILSSVFCALISQDYLKMLLTYCGIGFQPQCVSINFYQLKEINNVCCIIKE